MARNVREGAGKRGAILHNETADRKMKSYLISAVELRSLSHFEAQLVSSTGVGSFMLSTAVALHLAWKVESYAGAVPAMLVAYVVAAAFYGWGIMAWRNRRTIIKDIKEGSGESPQ